MNISSEKAEFKDGKFETVVIGLFEGADLPSGYVKQLDQALGGTIEDLVINRKFKCTLNQTHLIYTRGMKTGRILLIGLGKYDQFNTEKVRSASGNAALKIKEYNTNSYAVLVFGEGCNVPINDIIQDLVVGAELSLYSFDRYKTKIDREKVDVDKLVILVNKHENFSIAKRSIIAATSVVDGVKVARDLSNMPGNYCTPTILANVALDISRKHGLACKILESRDISRLKMGGLMGVSSGSREPPKLIVLEYRGGNTNEKPVVLVGKAVTFDSGGISIKPADKMEQMKHDKSGGTTVIGTMQAVADLKLPLNLVGIVPVTENLLGGDSYRPGDVLTFYKGKTAEIINTDAEGRLILADAISYSLDYKPQAIVDLATLTGACVIALGNVASGLFSNNDELRDRVVRAGEYTGERVWEFPLWKEYSEQIKSDVADIKNTGGRGGGAITAAAFISEFVENYPWVHLDIAGTAWVQDNSMGKSYLPKGATGVGVRLLTQMLQNWKKLPSNS